MIHGGIGMNKKYIVRLTIEERECLEDLVSKGKAAAHRIKHANILLKIDANGPAWSDEEAADDFGCHPNTSRNIRQRFVEQGLEAALERKKRANPPTERKLDGEAEARLIAISCSKPPEGRSRWTLKMLADELVVLEIVDEISDQTVRRTLKKTNFNLIAASAG